MGAGVHDRLGSGWFPPDRRRIEVGRFAERREREDRDRVSVGDEGLRDPRQPVAGFRKPEVRRAREHRAPARHDLPRGDRRLYRTLVAHGVRERGWGRGDRLEHRGQEVLEEQLRDLAPTIPSSADQRHRLRHRLHRADLRLGGGRRRDARPDLQRESRRGLRAGAGRLQRRGGQRPPQRDGRRRGHRRQDGDADAGPHGALDGHGAGPLHEAVRQSAAGRGRQRRGDLPPSRR